MTGANNTPFSFHCMICFEEFHPEARYPVVLPCGHTYVCHVCANRLDKCMECRTPLYELVHHPRTGSPGMATRYNARSRGLRDVKDPPPQPPMKRRLALPKNVVLLSLIEATELASADARQKFQDSPKSNPYTEEDLDQKVLSNESQKTSPTVPDLHSMGSMLDADDEEEKIKISTSLAVGVAGTYAVAAKDGLEIYTSRPSISYSERDAGQDDVETMVRVYHLDQANSSGEENSPDKDSANPPGGENDPLKLCYGDRVQVVSVGNGWAKLARGYGFVRAEKNQLVKGTWNLRSKLQKYLTHFKTVGGSVDRACKLEAMLCSLSNRRKALRIEQSKIDNEFIRFMNELQHSLQNDEDLTVILADTFSMPVEPERPVVEQEEKKVTEADYPQKPPPAPSTPPPESTRSLGRFACFAGSSLADVNDTQEHTGYLRAALTNPEFLGLRGSQEADPEASRLFPSSSHPSPSAMRAGAQRWREQRGRAAADGGSVNFRTGMSGHMALLSNQSHGHNYLEPSWFRPLSSQMSSHSGLSMSKGSMLHGLFNSLTLPSIGTPPRRDESPGSQVHHTGSM